MRPNLKTALLGLALLITLTGCNLALKTPDAAATLQAVYTVQALTLQALQTQAVFTPTPHLLPTMQFPTLPPLGTPTVTPTGLAPLPTVPIPTNMPIDYCNWAEFVKDVTVPDGTVFRSAETFTKTWRLKNIGTCIWNKNYALVFARGDAMKSPASVNLAGEVYPGQTVDVSVNFTAPVESGRYVGYWVLRTDTGVLFGLGATAKSPIYVDVSVSGNLSAVYNFASQYCSADWQSAAGDLGCPGNPNGKKGYVLQENNPQLENGNEVAGRGILMSPQKVSDGYLQGYFPAFNVRSGDQFTSIVDCQYGADNCDVIFRLDYKVGKDSIKTLWQAREVYDGEYATVNLDLSSLAGKKVTFILTILANGSADGDRALWINPAIRRIMASTKTPTLTSPASRTPTMTATRRPPRTRTPTPTATRTKRPTNTPTP